MSNRLDRAIAIVIVFVLHAALLAIALRGVPVAAVGSVVHDTPLDITWIPRRPSPVRVEPRVSTVQASRPRRPTRGVQPSSPLPATARAADVHAVDVAPSVAADASNAPVPARMDLRLQEPVPGFERNPLARRGPPIEAYQDRMKLQFVDPSIGGTWRRLTKAKTCSDLRRALRSADGGAYGVIESMRELGCPI